MMSPIYNYSERISVDWNPEFKDDAISFGQKYLVYSLIQI